MKRLEDEPPADAVVDVEARQADELLDQVLESAGELHVGEDDARNFNDLVDRSIKSNLRPPGKKLVAVPRYGRTLSVVLVDNFDELIDRAPVHLLGRVRRYHPAVKNFKDNRDIQWVSEDHVPRATLILQSFVEEAERRGLKIFHPNEKCSQANKWNRRRKSDNAHLFLENGDDIYSVQIRELPARGGNKLEYDWRHRPKIPIWMKIRGYEFISSGKLNLIINGRYTPYDGKHFREGKRQTLEERLPEVFRQLEIYHAESEQQEALKALESRLQAERQARLETEARKQFVEAKRWQHFKELSLQWQALEKHRDFLQRARIAAQVLDEKSKVQTLAALEDSEAHINKLDPIENPTLLNPVVPEPTQEDLKPYLPQRSIFHW